MPEGYTINLHGKTVLVTGGSRGIGAACAELFARAGADVAIAYRADRTAAGAVSRAIMQSGKEAFLARGDVSIPADCRRIALSVVKSLGPIDILVNSAGIWEHGPIATLSPAKWRKTMAVNLDGTANMIVAVLPSMIRRGSGVIVNIASTAGQRGEPEHSHYAASKGGVIALTKSLGAELAPRGIRVNCVAPGWVDTDMVARTLKNPPRKSEIVRSIPRGRVATAMEIAGPALFLASDLALHIIGATISVNGGSVLE